MSTEATTWAMKVKVDSVYQRIMLMNFALRGVDPYDLMTDSMMKEEFKILCKTWKVRVKRMDLAFDQLIDKGLIKELSNQLKRSEWK